MKQAQRQLRAGLAMLHQQRCCYEYAMTFRIGLSFKALRVGDANALALLHAAAFERGWGADEFAALLGIGAWGFSAHDAAGDLVGFVLMQGEGDPEIITLAVAPPARRCGIARRLVVLAAEAALQAGARRLILEVAVDNDGAQALYRELGFAAIGLRRGYYERVAGRVDACVMAASLPLADKGGAGLDIG